jgi:hypothetical protein
MKDIIKTVEGLPLIIKLVLALPCLDIVWAVMRVIRSLNKNNLVGVVIAIALIIVGLPFVWLFDIICILLKGNIWWID